MLRKSVYVALLKKKKKKAKWCSGKTTAFEGRQAWFLNLSSAIPYLCDFAM